VERLIHCLRQQPRAWLYIEALTLTVAIGFSDYITGYEVSIYPFYSIPILLMVWVGDVRLAIVISLLSTIAWWAVDKSRWPRLFQRMASPLGGRS